MATNPYRGQLWLLAAEIGTIFFLATIAGQSEETGKVVVLLVVVLGMIFVIIHGDQIKADVSTLSLGAPITSAPVIPAKPLSSTA